MSWLDTLDDIRTRDFSKVSAQEREKAARDVINLCSYASAVVAISPIPFSDVVLMLPIQTGMVMTVGHIYGRRVDKASAKDLILELGATAGVGFLARQGIKALLPVFGALLTVVPAFAANWAMGRVAMEYFKNPDASKEELKQVFERAKEEGNSLFSKDAFNNFRKKNEADIHAVAKAQDAEPSPDEEPEQARAAAPAAKKKATTKKAVEKKPLGKPATAKKAAAKKASRKAAAQSSEPEEGAEAPLTVRTLIERELPRRIKARNELARDIQAVIHLDIRGDEGGQWTVDLTRADRWVGQGLKGEPRVTVRCADSDFLKIATGRKDAKMAVLSGALEFEPLDLELAGQIGQLLA
ncbi:SCP2 sterol-binding domain-containing protein [Vitiosangium sp. GDMCC 1.1324]|uniref:DUF697 domain-containing protein n=1 Tax=Vitiosangium sp. (strain GDMCC 1.1324) TaxID=2138576 RepID=UPI0011B521BF|nr:SCP2 sterol-binding domain-containing protein [Vitiosangium sp. GDMCC 1.1324]